MSDDRPIPTPRYRAALEQHPDALSALPYSTRQRRLDGGLPPIFKWLLRYPDLLDALAEDARAYRHAAPTKDAA